jgi:hypothetical protein
MGARKKARRLHKVESMIAELQSEYEELRADLLDWKWRESKRLGVDVPANALLLDILELIEITEDDKWLWLGVTNNKNLPTIRYRDGQKAHERSVVRVLAEFFEIIDEDWEGTLYPTNGTDDVNPWHRELRALPEGKFRGTPRGVYKFE